MDLRLRALIFDFDGLMVDTESAIASAWADIHAEAGLRADPAVMHAIVGHVEIDGDLWRAFPPSADRAVLDERLSALARSRCAVAPVLPGVRELITEARAAGLRLAVASNSSHRHVDGHLAARDLAGFFDAVVCREDVARGKPAPDLYLSALRKLGVDAEEAVAFEDSVPGHEAAAAAGLRVVVVPNPSTAHQTFLHATMRCETMAELGLGLLRDLPVR